MFRFGQHWLLSSWRWRPFSRECFLCLGSACRASLSDKSSQETPLPQAGFKDVRLLYSRRWLTLEPLKCDSLSYWGFQRQVSPLSKEKHHKVIASVWPLFDTEKAVKTLTFHVFLPSHFGDRCGLSHEWKRPSLVSSKDRFSKVFASRWRKTCHMVNGLGLRLAGRLAEGFLDIA